MEIDFRDLAAMACAQNRLIIGDLLHWRQQMCAATAISESTMAFLVPYDMLVGVTQIGGSPVIHSIEVTRPGIVLPVPEVPSP